MMNTTGRRVILVIVFLAFVYACTGSEEMGKVTDTPALVDVSVWENLHKKKIVFGHQSVGFNIIEGIRDLQEANSSTKIIINKVDEETDDIGVGINHFTVGSNKDPVSKIKGFEQFMINKKTSEIDIALFKLCYVDITPETNINEIFALYKDTMQRLKTGFPEVTFIHVTVPLGTSVTTWKIKIKELLGIPIWGYENNIARNQYNDLLRQEYSGKEPIYDLARVESTYPDGSRSTFRKAGKEYFSMAPEYTYDHGHLNEVGRQRAAGALLRLLAENI